MAYRYPLHKDGKIFFPKSRMVYLGIGVRLSACLYEHCYYPTLTCNKCHYGA